MKQLCIFIKTLCKKRIFQRKSHVGKVLKALRYKDFPKKKDVFKKFLRKTSKNLTKCSVYASITL